MFGSYILYENKITENEGYSWLWIKDYGFDLNQLKKILKEQKYRLCSKADLNDDSVNNYALSHQIKI